MNNFKTLFYPNKKKSIFDYQFTVYAPSNKTLYYFFPICFLSTKRNIIFLNKIYVEWLNKGLMIQYLNCFHVNYKLIYYIELNFFNINVPLGILWNYVQSVPLLHIPITNSAQLTPGTGSWKKRIFFDQRNNLKMKIWKQSSIRWYSFMKKSSEKSQELKKIYGKLCLQTIWTMKFPTSNFKSEGEFKFSR